MRATKPEYNSRFLFSFARQSCMREVALAMIRHKTSFLMHLRDFKPWIVNPGEWGFFAGGLSQGETPSTAMVRELWEELEFVPRLLTPFNTFQFTSESLRVHVYHCSLHVPVEQLNLHEGQELGIFEAESILTGKLVSQKWQRMFPITLVSMKIFSEFYHHKSVYEK